MAHPEEYSITVGTSLFAFFMVGLCLTGLVACFIKCIRCLFGNRGTNRNQRLVLATNQATPPTRQPMINPTSPLPQFQSIPQPTVIIAPSLTLYHGSSSTPMYLSSGLLAHSSPHAPYAPHPQQIPAYNNPASESVHRSASKKSLSPPTYDDNDLPSYDCAVLMDAVEKKNKE